MIYIARHIKYPPDEYNYINMVIHKPAKTFRMQTIERIRKVVKDKTGFDPYFETKDRVKEFVNARQLFLYFVIKYTKTTQRQAGRLVDKDHTTAFYAMKCVNKFKEIEPAYAEVFNVIEEELKK